MTDMTRDEAVRDLVATILYEAGWSAPCDAQWSRLMAALPDLRAALQAQGEPVGYVWPSTLSLLKEQTLVEAMIFRKPTGQAAAAIYTTPPDEGVEDGRYPCPLGAGCAGRDCNKCANFTPPAAKPDAVAGLVDTSGIVRVLRDFFFDAANQQYIPTLTIEFAPVPVGAPNDAEGWKARDQLAAALAQREVGNG